ncbi:sucrose synthase [Aeoliella sp. ICT_H6.2]|uniref:Sucrose synthase n=1 Tax=Aeoliella straminimaris TaxID=2954799 RepID=A0A9X2FE80_9BACT|nr:sucrose synthase [Aeoliella straminimaris]MCO6046417.1 sucrose synthase [Aeoliella straminimaris]
MPTDSSTLTQHKTFAPMDSNNAAATTAQNGNGAEAIISDPTDPPVVDAAKRFFAGLKASGDKLFLGHTLAARLDEFLAQPHAPSKPVARKLKKMLRGCPEVMIDGDLTYIVLRPSVGTKQLVRLHPAAHDFESVSRGDYLQLKDAQIQGVEEADKQGLVIDFRPYFRDLPLVTDPGEMGSGISILNRHLSAQMYQNPERFRKALVDFLKETHLNSHNILLNEQIRTVEEFAAELSNVRSLLDDYDGTTPYEPEVAHEMRSHGFEAGWGATVERIANTLHLLEQVLNSADAVRFEELLARLPLVHSVLMVSPHGWFAQEGVLGRPDTGGQVTYVLDQARALEHEINERIVLSGLNVCAKVIVLTRLIPEADGTTCNVPREKIYGSENAWIVRVPFRDQSGEVLPHWISRFQLWPYVENFAEEARSVVVTELMGKPDFIIGHYTDGNLVAHLLADRLGTTHCACVHALEKTKYLLSAAHWADLEDQYRFSMHFTADLLAYNSADFIVSSSFREIAGTRDEMGMIESYDLFSMPGLYRVQSGFNPRLARHNIVPPGASEEFFYPNEDHSRRVPQIAKSLAERFLTAEPSEGNVGHLDDPNRPPIFAMARMDKVKNLSGLVEMFGKHETLREQANLLLVTSLNTVEASSDPEEIEEVNRTYEFIHKYELDGHIRWCAARLDKTETGEIYRLIADRRGVFAQPAFMETFGLTVIEAMACGCPVVATCFGGPSEIILPGECGDIADPNDQHHFAELLLRVIGNEELWQRYHEGGIQRVAEAYTWRRHASRLLSLANVYSYWNHTDVMNRPALDRYIHTLYHTVYRPRTQSMTQ